MAVRVCSFFNLSFSFFVASILFLFICWWLFFRLLCFSFALFFSLFEGPGLFGFVLVIVRGGLRPPCFLLESSKLITAQTCRKVNTGAAQGRAWENRDGIDRTNVGDPGGVVLVNEGVLAWRRGSARVCLCEYASLEMIERAFATECNR